MPSCLSGYFAVMLRQAALAVLVVYGSNFTQKLL